MYHLTTTPLNLLNLLNIYIYIHNQEDFLADPSQLQTVCVCDLCLCILYVHIRDIRQTHRSCRRDVRVCVLYMHIYGTYDRPIAAADGIELHAKLVVAHEARHPELCHVRLRVCMGHMWDI